MEHFSKYVESPVEFGDRTTLPETRVKKPAAKEFIVEKIIAHKFDKKGAGIKYLVRWEGAAPIPTDILGKKGRNGVDDEEGYTPEWVGLNKNCSAIPAGALDLSEERDYQNESTGIDQFGRYDTIEWADEPDWYAAETHSRGWIPLHKEGDTSRGTWAQDTKKVLAYLGPLDNGSFQLAPQVVDELKRDLGYFRELLEDAGSTTRDPRRLAKDVHGRTSRVLDVLGHIAWWTAAVPSWLHNLPNDVVGKVWDLNLREYKLRGFLITITRDWREVNIPLLILFNVPLFYVWDLFDERDKRFARLNPRIIRGYEEAVASAGVEGLWGDEIPHLASDFAEAARYDRFLQLKIDPYSCPHLPLPTENEISGVIEHWVIDCQHWRHRLVEVDKDIETLHHLYHHIVVESRKDQVMRVIFHRFHPKPLDTIMEEDGSITEEEITQPDLSAIRERFKGRCAPKFGQTFDPETGVERSKTLGPEAPVDEVAEYKEKLLLIAPARDLGSRVLFGPHPNPHEADTTRIGRSLGSRLTSPDSDHSSEPREHDSSEPMAFVVGWADAMGRESWGDHKDNYMKDRNTHVPHFEVRPQHRYQSPSYDDARSSIAASDGHMSRAGTPRRSASPERRGRRRFPLRLSSPPRFQALPGMLATMGDIANRRKHWLNNFADWGRAATWVGCLWRIPIDFVWTPDVLQDRYLLLSETSEFRLRYQALVDPQICFPRHVLELAIERGIPFAIGFKLADLDRFCPKEKDEGRMVTKAMTDIKAKGPRLHASPSIRTVYDQYCRNMGKIARSPQARSIIARGGGASWLIRAYLGVDLAKLYMEGPSVKTSVHHGGVNNSGDDDRIDMSWDDISEGDYEALFGYIVGPNGPEGDTTLYPTDEILEECSHHYYGEWNLFCDLTFKRLKKELDDKKGRCRTKKDWVQYFQSSNHGKYKPKLRVQRAFIENGMERIKGAFDTESWNKRRITTIKLDLPAQFKADF
ncbi:hypothetical protein B0H17DRAFT_1196276 [Mycena rosella]|uniref:Chromo domain-containing protein n=1 Tax=Mycena rosella TaxID=1033263 RepID=A0AAD7GL12_MYCRO|nr:hypothetical protein B0H17DRAFT_1196276 [Mycena rosella]